MRVQKNPPGQTGYLIAGVIVLDIILAIWLLWRALDGKPDSAASIQAIAAIIGLVLQVLLIVFNLRGMQITTSQLLWTFGNNRLIQAGSFCIAFMLALLLSFDFGASSAAMEIVSFTDQEVSLDILQAEKLSTDERTIKCRVTCLPFSAFNKVLRRRRYRKRGGHQDQMGWRRIKSKWRCQLLEDSLA